MPRSYRSQTMDNLPQELVNHTVNELWRESSNSLNWRQTMTNCSMLSPPFRAACLPYLFRSVCVTDLSGNRDLESLRQLIASSAHLIPLIEELDIRHIDDIQPSFLKQVLSELPRVRSLLLEDASFSDFPKFEAPVVMKPTSLRSLKYFVCDNGPMLYTLLGLFPEIEQFTICVDYIPTKVQTVGSFDYPGPRLQLKELTVSL